MFLANLVEALALFLSLAALATAVGAVRVVHRRTRPEPPAASTPAHRHQPTSPARPASHPTQPSNGGGQGNGGGQARGNALRDQLRAFLTQHAGSDFSLVQLSKAMDRRSATVSYAVTKLVEAGEVQLTSPKPRRYAITPAGAQTHQHQPTQPVQPTLVETAATQPAPADQQTTPPIQPGNGGGQGNGNGQARGNALRDQLRAFLTEHAESDFSLVELSKAVDRRSATVSYAVTKLVEAGEVQLTSPKPRRYAIAPAGAQTHQHQPTPEPTAEPAPESTVIVPPVTAETKPAAEPAPAPATPRLRKGAARSSAEQLRDKVRAFLAEHAGSDFSLLELAAALHVESARLGYAMVKLVESAEVEVTSTAPRRRYTLAGSVPSLIPATPRPESAEPAPARRRARASGTQPTATVTTLPAERRTSTTATTTTRRGGVRRR